MKSITIYTRPIPLNQMYRCWQNRYLLSKPGREVKAALVQEIALGWQNEPLTGDVTLNVIHYFKNKVHGDIDAYLKALLDSMEGIVFENDKQVNELSVVREYDKENPRTVLQIL